MRHSQRNRRTQASNALPPEVTMLATSVAQDTTVNFGEGGNADPKSYYTVLALFLLSVPGVLRLALKTTFHHGRKA
jgi:hypothetical protein